MLSRFSRLSGSMKLGPAERIEILSVTFSFSVHLNKRQLNYIFEKVHLLSNKLNENQMGMLRTKMNKQINAKQND